MLKLILLLLLSKSCQQILLWLYYLSLKNFIIALNQWDFLFGDVLLIWYTRSWMRSSAGHTIHIDVPFITNDNYLLSIICFLGSLLLLWDLVNNHLLNCRLFPFFGLLPRTHLSFIVPLNLWILFPGFIHNFLLSRWHRLFFIIFIWVPHPSLLFILSLCCRWPSNPFRYHTRLLLILFLYLHSLLLNPLHCPCKVPERPTRPVSFLRRWIWRCLRWLIVLLLKNLPASRDLSRVGLLLLVRFDVVERCAAAWCKALTALALDARGMWKLVEIVIVLRAAQDRLGLERQRERGWVQTTFHCHDISFGKV